MFYTYCKSFTCIGWHQPLSSFTAITLQAIVIFPKFALPLLSRLFTRLITHSYTLHTNTSGIKKFSTTYEGNRHFQVNHCGNRGFSGISYYVWPPILSIHLLKVILYKRLTSTYHWQWMTITSQSIITKPVWVQLGQQFKYDNLIHTYVPFKIVVLVYLKKDIACTVVIPVIVFDAKFHSVSVHTEYTIGWAVISVYIRQGAVSKVYYMHDNYW